MREIVHIQAGQCGNQVRRRLSLPCDFVTREHAVHVHLMCALLYHSRGSRNTLGCLAMTCMATSQRHDQPAWARVPLPRRAALLPPLGGGCEIRLRGEQVPQSQIPRLQDNANTAHEPEPSAFVAISESKTPRGAKSCRPPPQLSSRRAHRTKAESECGREHATLPMQDKGAHAGLTT